MLRMKMLIKSLYTHTDVTCVEIIKNHIFAGIGNHLQIFNLSDQTLVQKFKILEGQNIFGIKPNPTATKLIIYGEKHLSVAELNPNLQINCILSHAELTDWVLVASWIEEGSKFLTMTMHNKVTLWTENLHIVTSVKCEEHCILYSAHIGSHSFYEDVLLMSGTVFSDVLLWRPSLVNDNGMGIVLNRLKGHKGAIFSVHYQPTSGLICSSSDDRSAILWKITDPIKLEVTQLCQVYGHYSRPFRCLLLNDYFVTAGEDSLLILWNFAGKMVKKFDTQGGTVWSLCATENVICTGGNDGAILTFSISTNFSKNMVNLPSDEIPKSVAILSSKNVLCFTENAFLLQYNTRSNEWINIGQIPDLSKYCVMQVSPCRKLVALAGFEGQLYLFRMQGEILQCWHKYRLENQTRIFAFHWLDCKTFIVTQANGLLSLFYYNKRRFHFIQNYILPPSKEQWSTCACILGKNLIVGDRRGNLHNFQIGPKSLQDPINTIKKAHSYLGVTNLHCINQNVMSLGRDGVIKKHTLTDQVLTTLETNKTKFSWLTALELQNKLLLSFSEDRFVISDMKFQRTLFEVPCGGGHRSWNSLTSPDELKFAYIKRKSLNFLSINLKELLQNNVVEGLHIREINCCKLIQFDSKLFMISGGEDTILRISRNFLEGKFEVVNCLKVHLSSIRAIFVHPLGPDKYLVVTGGGRSQIICWELNLPDCCCEVKFNLYQPQIKLQPETRIMDLVIVKGTDKKLKVVAGTSDGTVKSYLLTENLKLEPEDVGLHSQHSITKLATISYNSVDVLVSMATDGVLRLWSYTNHLTQLACFPRLHQSGINSFSYHAKPEGVWILTGGDDNCISLSLLTGNNWKKQYTLQNSALHCSQITGAYLRDGYFITSAIDQRVIVHKWTWINEEVKLEVEGLYNTTIADSQGMDVLKLDGKLILCVYGNGFECLEVDL